MPTMKYDYDPYTGALITTTEEGVVITYGSGGKQISSKTASQVALESQIKSAGGTVNYNTEQQISSGLQSQVKTALKGEIPGTFKVETPEGTFNASSGITPEHLRGSAGSKLSLGYENIGGVETPIKRLFTSSKGETINAVPLKKVGNEWIWNTNYGNITATPERLQTEIERKMMVDRITEQGGQIMAKKIYVKQQSRTIPARAEFLLENPFKPTGYLIGSAILHGKGFASEGIRKYEREREDWLENILDTEDRTGLAFSGMINPVALVLGAKIIPGASSFLSKSSVGTGIGLGTGLGLTAIGTFETMEGIRLKDESKAGGGFLLASFGAGITKGMWEGGVVPEIKKFAPVKKIPTDSYTEIDIKSKDFLEDELITKGKGKSQMTSKLSDAEIKSEAEFIFRSKELEKDFTWTEEVGGVKRTLVEDSFFGAKKITELTKAQKFLGSDATVPFSEAGKDFFLSTSESRIEGGEMVEGARVSRKMLDEDGITVFFGKGATARTTDTSISVITDPFLSDVGSGGGTGTDIGLTFKPLTKFGTSLKASHEAFVESFLDTKIDSQINPILPGAKSKSKSKSDQDVMLNLEAISITESKSKTKTSQDQFLKLTPMIDTIGDAKIDRDNFLGSSSIQAFDTLSTLDRDQSSFLKTDIGIGKTPGITTGIDPFLEEPGIGSPGGILWPSWNLKDDFLISTKKGTGKRSFASTPSFIALEFGITGKMPKFLTGIEVRPLPKGTKIKKDKWLEIDF